MLRRKLPAVAILLLFTVLLSACASGRAFRRGQEAAAASDWDAAVTYLTRAVQEDPDNAEYKIALERAMQNASRLHMTRAREFEEQGQLTAAMQEYRAAARYDPGNRLAATKAAQLERTIRDQIEAARPTPPIEQMRERVRQTTQEPILNPASREPLRIQFTNASLKDILNFIGNATGINVTYDRDFQDRPYTISLDGVTLEEGLNQILTANDLFYKVLNERTVIVVPDTPQKRAQYEEQVIRTFFVSHADVQELSQLISTVIRVPQMAVQPMVAVNKTANTITVRATAPVAEIIERIIDSNDKPRAEIVIDVEILEVNRTRARQIGLNLTQYALGGIFSPEVAPPNTATPPNAVPPPPPFNLNTISQGVSTADFYLAVPSAFIRFLETDSQTKLIAKPQLRGSEGAKLTLNLGDEVPVPSTVFTPIATGGAATNPLTSFSYRPVGVNIEMTPRVTFEGEIVLDLLVETSTLGEPIDIAGQSLPTFGSRKVVTRLRLREGESNLLAGLLREDERRALRGFPGIMRVPILRQLLSDSDTSVGQTDIVMLLTPHIVRTHELTEQDLSPIYIGTQRNIGIGGPAPLIAVPGTEEPAQPPAADVPTIPPAPAPAAPAGVPPSAGAAPGVPQPPAAAAPGVPGSTPGTTSPQAPSPVVPPGSSPVPGTTMPSAPPPAESPVSPPATAPETPAQQAPTAATAEPPAAAAAGEPPASPPPAVSATTPGQPITAPAGAQVLVTPPGTEFRVGAGPYTVPISITNASQLSILTLTVRFNPTVLRVRGVQEGSFMRQGGVQVAFTQQVDAAGGRVDIAITRTGDQTGASGAGLLAAILFDATSVGSTTLETNGAATTASGSPAPLAFAPVTVTVR